MVQAVKQSYSFDVVLKESSFQNTPGPPFYYTVRVLHDYLDINEERQFADHFPNQILTEFLASPCDLIGCLSSHGISVKVYQNDELLGTGKYVPSLAVLRTLADPSFTVEDFIQVDVENASKRKIGYVLLKMRLCSLEVDLDTRLLPYGCYDICHPLDKSTNPNDIVFTLGRSGRCAEKSCITDERLMTHAGAPNSCPDKKSGPPEKDCGCRAKGNQPVPVEEPNDCERKMLRRLLEELEVGKERSPTPPESHRGRHCKCSPYTSSSESNCGDAERWDWPEESDLQGTLSPQQLRRLSLAGCLGVCPQTPPPKLVVNKYTPPQLCPMCHSNITWLPKVSDCPYCGYKRFELDKPSEEPFDETATAADVLRKHVLFTRMDSERSQANRPVVDSPNSPTSCRSNTNKDCTCTSPRICTACRIKEISEKAVAGLSSPKVKTAVASLIQVAVPKKPPPTPAEHRQQLVKIFTEMRDKFKEKDTEKELAQKAFKDCREIIAKKRKRAFGRRSPLKKILNEIDNNYPSTKKKKVSTRKVQRRSKSKRYTFLVRREPSAARLTHQPCTQGSTRVPSHMGWMWNKSVGARRGWKPGAIRKPIRQMMAYFLRDYPVDNVGYSRFHYRAPKQPPKPTEEPLIQYPTLHIVKRHDEYTITMRPLKDPKSLALAANPYANMRPIVFRISKDPFATGIRNIKLNLMDQGIPVCSCNQPVASCFCRSHIDHKLLVQEVQKLSEAQGWKDVSDTFVYSDLSESDSENELEFGVTPPAGIVKPERLHKPDRVNSETQYNENDWAQPTMYPHPPNPMVQYGTCVMGERKGKFPWIMGKGFVHEEPKPAKKINKPKKPKEKGKKTPGRLKGGCDSFTFRGDFHPYNGSRTWHKSNEPGRNPLYYF